MPANVQHVPLSDVLPNRYRRVERYRISESKIEALLASFANSGFWDGSIQARPCPAQLGKYEIAFGHHRVEAARRFGLSTIGIVVADRSDADMLRMMADENREEFKGDHLVAVETVAATIDAVGAGEIALPAVAKDTPKRNIHVAPGGATYTCSTIARFLGWTRGHGDQEPEPTRACRLAFEAYHERATIEPALQFLPEDRQTREVIGAVVATVKAARVTSRRANHTEAQTRAAEHRAAKRAVQRIAEHTPVSAIVAEAAKVRSAAASVPCEPLDATRRIREQVARVRQHLDWFEAGVTRVFNEPLTAGEEIDTEALQYLLRNLDEMRSRSARLFEKWIEWVTPQSGRDESSAREERGHGNADLLGDGVEQAERDDPARDLALLQSGEECR